MAPRRAVLVVVAGVLLTSGCAAKRRTVTTAPPRATSIVLLPDDDTETTGRAVVSNAHGRLELAAPWTSARVSPDQAPAARAEISSAQRQRLDRLRATLPPPPAHFVIYFPFESDEAAPDSRDLIAQVLTAAARHPAPEVVVVGHTDTTGPAERNLQLGRRRASAVRDLLVAARIDPSIIEVVSHGEAAPRIPTGDEVLEPGNRRVEVTVR